MKLRVLLLFLSMVCATPPLVAAERKVAPGDGTLQTAVSLAQDGDTLILEDGVYSGSSGVIIDKALTLRPVSRATSATVDVGLTVTAPNKTVTIQGLRLRGQVSFNSAFSVRLLENDVGANIAAGANWDVSEFYCVGNAFANGVDASAGAVASYVAGNILANGKINVFKNARNAWIVGNSITQNEIAQAISVSVAGGQVRILSNRVSCHFDANPGDCVSTTGARHGALIASNLVRVVHSTTGKKAQIAVSVSGREASDQNYAAKAEILNNLVTGSLGDLRTGPAIAVRSASANIQGNIIYRFPNDGKALISVTGGGASLGESSTVAHNLCFGGSNGATCPAGDGNLDANPRFVDELNWQLQSDSPAIDAGPAALELADLDRTRNDIGIHGGPWSIGQYDAQRRATGFAPYVFPLVELQSVGSGMTLRVQALGVARLR